MEDRSWRGMHWDGMWSRASFSPFRMRIAGRRVAGATLCRRACSHCSGLACRRRAPLVAILTAGYCLVHFHAVPELGVEKCEKVDMS